MFSAVNNKSSTSLYQTVLENERAGQCKSLPFQEILAFSQPTVCEFENRTVTPLNLRASQESEFILWLSEDESIEEPFCPISRRLPELKLWLSEDSESEDEGAVDFPNATNEDDLLLLEITTPTTEVSHGSNKRARSSDGEDEAIENKKQKIEEMSIDQPEPLEVNSIELERTDNEPSPIKKDGESETSREVYPSQERISESSTEEKLTVGVAIITDEIYLKHATRRDDPERLARITSIESALTQAGLKTDANSMAPRAATEKELSLCHSVAYINRLKLLTKKFKESGKKDTYNESFRSTKECRSPYVGGDFQLSPGTWDAAVYAVGAPLTALDMMADTAQKVQRAFCIVRPPGHHAHANTGSGFCVFNNVAIAAKYALENKNFKRVLIVDWDAHHGDGVQALTEYDPNIFYFSVHKDTTSGEGFYPGTTWGHADQIGKGEGVGTVMNWPIDPAKANPREEVNKAFEALVARMEEYKPELVLISCGFDGHKDDILVAGDHQHGLGLENDDYLSMTRKCVEIANKHGSGKIVSVLEGGYNLEAIAAAAEAHVRGLMEA